jgi:hypothetical protein
MSWRRKEEAQIDNLIERLRPVFEKTEIREQELILLMRKKNSWNLRLFYTSEPTSEEHPTGLHSEGRLLANIRVG